jgi:hypothetical protein
MKQGTVSSRVALLLRSAEVKPMFRDFKNSMQVEFFVHLADLRAGSMGDENLQAIYSFSPRAYTALSQAASIKSSFVALIKWLNGEWRMENPILYKAHRY